MFFSKWPVLVERAPSSRPKASSPPDPTRVDWQRQRLNLASTCHEQAGGKGWKKTWKGIKITPSESFKKGVEQLKPSIFDRFIFSFQGCIPIVNLAERPEKVTLLMLEMKIFQSTVWMLQSQSFGGGKLPFTQDDPKLNRGLRFLSYFHQMSQLKIQSVDVTVHAELGRKTWDLGYFRVAKDPCLFHAKLSVLMVQKSFKTARKLRNVTSDSRWRKKWLQNSKP